jgi:hypothetical protein
MNRRVSWGRWWRVLTQLTNKGMKWIDLMAALAMASVGCAHSQRPEPRIHVVSEDADGGGGAGLRP